MHVTHRSVLGCGLPAGIRTQLVTDHLTLLLHLTLPDGNLSSIDAPFEGIPAWPRAVLCFVVLCCALLLASICGALHVVDSVAVAL
jgi:hypothetical protein